MLKTKNRTTLSFTAGILAIMLIFSLCSFTFEVGTSYDTGDSDDVLTSTYYVEQYLKDKYGDSSAKITAGTPVVLNTQNYSQTTLNNYYKTETGTAVSGTCSEVAATSLIEFYKGVDNFTTNADHRDTFVDILDMALDKGYYSVEDGTAQNKLDSLVTKSFGLYGSSNKGNNDYFNIYKTLCEKVRDDDVPVLFSIIGHTMVGCGYVTYTTTYTTSSGATKTATDNFIIVNDGWSNTRQYSYFPEELVSTNIFNRWDFCITKVS